MKKITLLLLGATIMFSCGRNKDEQMLYEYQQKNVSALNFDLEDLDFEIHKMEKLADITAADSMKHLKFEFVEYWKENPEQSLVDTLSFKFVKNVLNKNIALQDTLHKMYQESVLTAIKYDDYSWEFESKRKRDQALDEWSTYKKALSEIERIENIYNVFSENPDSILSAKYRASYSLRNPIFGNAKQTFDKIFFTNSAQNKFITEESIDE